MQIDTTDNGLHFWLGSPQSRCYCTLNWVNNSGVFLIFLVLFYLSCVFRSDQMSRHPCRTSESVVPEFQLVSEQASCSALGEILGRYFLVMGKEESIYWKEVWTRTIHTIVWMISWQGSLVICDRYCSWLLPSSLQLNGKLLYVGFIFQS